MDRDSVALWLSLIGSGFFGIVMGWVTYGILRRSSRSSLSDIATVIGAVGGATVTGLFPTKTGAFGAYCIGLAIGFFAYLARASNPNAPAWLGEAPSAQQTIEGGGGLKPTAPKVGR